MWIDAVAGKGSRGLYLIGEWMITILMLERWIGGKGDMKMSVLELLRDIKYSRALKVVL